MVMGRGGLVERKTSRCTSIMTQSCFMDEEEMKIAYAPKEVDGIVLQPSEAELLTPKEKLENAVDVRTTEQFIAAGFDVNFVGPEGDLLASAASCAGGDAEEANADSEPLGAGADDKAVNDDEQKDPGDFAAAENEELVCR